MTDGTSMTSVDLGTVHLEAAPGWRFFPIDDRIVGRPASGVGVLQIVRLPDDAIPPPATHERCMAAAVAASEYQVDPPGMDRAKEWEDQCLAGGESFRSGGDFVRVWYRHCGDGLVAAWFACKLERAKATVVAHAIRDCDRMVASLRVPPPVS
jgi:hypothetical protein